MPTIHLRVTDAATGRPTPARVHLRTDDGREFVPFGRYTEFPLGRNEAVGAGLRLAGRTWFVTDGSCELTLPAGIPLRVEVSKGPEYRPLERTVTLGPGQMALRLVLERWHDRQATGRVAVDTRCHFLPPHDAALEAAAEDLDVVNLLATPQPYPGLDGTAYPTVPHLTAFSGQTPALERHGVAVVVNTLNRHPVLGQLALLHAHRPIFPLTFGGEESDDWGLCDWCDQCHRKGGLVVWADAFEPHAGVVGGEALVAAILGRVDAIEVAPGPRKLPLLPWLYRLWSAGVRLPLAGASGKASNREVLGAVRTYAAVQEPGGWVEAIRAGRTFVTTGPLLDWHLDGPRITAEARSLTPFVALELVANGLVVGTAEAALDDTKGEYRAAGAWPRPERGWVAVRCRFSGPGFAHSSPLAVDEPPADPAAAAALVRLIDQTRDWATTAGRYGEPRYRDQLLQRCAEAIARLGEQPGR